MEQVQPMTQVPSPAPAEPDLQRKHEVSTTSDDFVGDEDDDILDEETGQRTETEDEVDLAIASLEANGFELVPVEPRRGGRVPGENWYRIMPPGQGNRDAIGLLPRISIPAFLYERQENFSIHEGNLGLSSPDGRFVEFMISRENFRQRYIPPNHPYISPRMRCISAELDPSHEVQFPTLFGRLHLETRPTLSSLKRAIVVFHAGNRNGDCIEISSPSATLAARYFELVTRPFLADPVTANSVKVRFREPSSADIAVKRAKDVVSAFFFELSAMRRGAPRLHEPLRERERLPTPRQDEPAIVRFPPQVVDARASALFVSAEDAVSPVSRYLTYYQSIEYFLPFSDERTSIARLRRDIFSPGFDLGNDTFLLKLVRTVGKQTSKSERESFKDLIGLTLTQEKAEALVKIARSRRQDHFTKRGPIAHVGLINTSENAKNKDTVSEIAERIYDLRCRIVHSKAAGGSVGADPLFPTDDEASFLTPDIELIRLVAIEVITMFATPNANFA
ncbi:hypothetical protein [Micromonospora sp. CMU55-4]|uniref:hypothetical protein n=1 Tax=Micromonospora sp. CMU55-4 TaxID=2717028 RepID=UPI00140D4F0E|nr:hypothetical protein [Micromonospora sp. CMU55-4]NHO84399.1 hypothetical protein [Micromonospora sp. CMU55-4]